MNIVGISEVEWFQAVDEMPLDWKRSINAWVAVSMAIEQVRANMRFFFKGCGESKERRALVQHYMRENVNIKERNGLSLHYQDSKGRWTKIKEG